MKVDNVNIVFLGDTGVGKTSIIRKYKKLPYNNTAITIGVDLYTDNFLIGVYQQKVKFWDTAGGIEFRNLIKYYYENAKIFVIIFDITNIRSYNNVEIWINEIKKETGIKDPKIILVGNKIDCKSRYIICEEKYPYPIYYVSAKSGKDICVLFEKIHNIVVESGYSNFNYIPFLKTPVLSINDINNKYKVLTFKRKIKKLFCCFYKPKYY
jgi:small GTP-binding protein